LRVSPAQLRHWQRMRGASDAEGAPAPAALGFQDLVSLRSLVGLLDRGIPVRRIRSSLDRLRERMPDLEDPLGALRAWPAARGRVALRHEGAWLEPDGQLLLDFVDEGEARAPVAEIVPGEGATGAGSAMEWFEQGCALDGIAHRHEEAVAAYRRAVELDPAFADAHCNLGTLYFHRGKRDAARQAYEAALAADASHLEAHYNLANLLEEAGRREAALHHYKIAVRLDPTFADAHLNLALLYDRLALPRHARDHWRRYLQLAPKGHWSELARERLEAPPAGSDS
jgi:tetratricopeptide (TPR) repeat protein